MKYQILNNHTIDTSRITKIFQTLRKFLKEKACKCKFVKLEIFLKFKKLEKLERLMSEIGLVF